MWSFRFLLCIIIVINVVNSSCCDGKGPAKSKCASKTIGDCLGADECKWKCWFSKSKTKEIPFGDYKKEKKVITDYEAHLKKSKKKKKPLDAKIVKAEKEKLQKSKKPAKKARPPTKGAYEDVIFSKKMISNLNKIKSNVDYVKTFGIISIDSKKSTETRLGQDVIKYLQAASDTQLAASYTPKPPLKPLKSTSVIGEPGPHELIRQKEIKQHRRRWLDLSDVESGFDESVLSDIDNDRKLLALSDAADLNDLPYSNVGQLWHEEWYDYPYTKYGSPWTTLDDALSRVVDKYKEMHAAADPASAEELFDWLIDDDEDDYPGDAFYEQVSYFSGYRADILHEILEPHLPRIFNRGGWVEAKGVGTIIKEAPHPTEVDAFYYYIITAAHCLYSVRNTLNKQRKFWKFVRINVDSSGFQAGSVLLDAQATAGDVKAWLPYNYQDGTEGHAVDWGILRLKKTDGAIAGLNLPVTYEYDANQNRTCIFATYDYNVVNFNRMKYKAGDEFEKENYMLWKVPNPLHDYKSGMSGTAIFNTVDNLGVTPNAIVGIYNGRDSMALLHNGLAARITTEKAWAITKILNGDWDIIADISQAHEEYMNHFFMEDIDTNAAADEYYADEYYADYKNEYINGYGYQQGPLHQSQPLSNISFLALMLLNIFIIIICICMIGCIGLLACGGSGAFVFYNYQQFAIANQKESYTCNQLSVDNDRI